MEGKPSRELRSHGSYMSAVSLRARLHAQEDLERRFQEDDGRTRAEIKDSVVGVEEEPSRCIAPQKEETKQSSQG